MAQLPTLPTVYTNYDLELKGGFFYVGRTTRSEKERYQEHVDGKGSAWTRLHPPIKMLESSVGDAFQEEAMTLRYMAQYGHQKVRGGSYVALKLTEVQVTDITKKLASSKDACYKCGKTGHFANKCPNDKMAVAPCKKSASNNTAFKTSFIKQNKVGCWRCGHTNHLADKCYAKTDIRGRVLPMR